jgi:hypothetical protein
MITIRAECDGMAGWDGEQRRRGSGWLQARREKRKAGKGRPG